MMVLVNLLVSNAALAGCYNVCIPGDAAAIATDGADLTISHLSDPSKRIQIAGTSQYFESARAMAISAVGRDVQFCVRYLAAKGDISGPILQGFSLRAR